MGRRAPRPIAEALRSAVAEATPPTLLARVQSAWPDAVGASLAEQAQPASERAGTVLVSCRSASWAHELSLMHDELLGRLVESLGDPSVKGLRFSVASDAFNS